ncbi:MAG: FAD-binding oxidoreductase [Actinobacteria bacterium]|nr:FAD-binding oxidoreductase [Actinomycetota bacterium]
MAHVSTSAREEIGADLVIIGAGIVGAMCAHYAIASGLRTIVIDRNSVASGTTGAGEGNIMVSDKSPGPELDLALISRELWFEVGARVGDSFELVAKGGVSVARSNPKPLHDLAESQSRVGVDAREVDQIALSKLEPFISPEIKYGVHYPQDAQCQPMLAAARILQDFQRRGGKVIARQEVLEIEESDGALSIRTPDMIFRTTHIINAAGTWAGEIAKRAGSDLPIMPRRGFILVTAPLPQYVFHKVYDSDYVDNVASSDADLQTSTVIEGTKSGTILIGASRERVGYDKSMSVPVIKKLARQATSLFPVLKDAQLLRVYNGFRPYSPDHLPVIGPDSKIKGLYHCAGHEGAGIGLSAASGKLIAELIQGVKPLIDPTPFSPARFQLAGVR